MRLVLRDRAEYLRHMASTGNPAQDFENAYIAANSDVVIDGRDPETMVVFRLHPRTAHRVPAHEGLHIALLRFGESEASKALDTVWARRRIPI